MDYSLCSQAVTVYREGNTGIFRQVAENCHLSRKDSACGESYGKSKEKQFLLIIPGNALPLQPGDRIFAGIGPEEVDWARFVPALVTQLYQAAYAKPCFWDGEIIHWEAGAERRML